MAMLLVVGTLAACGSKEEPETTPPDDARIQDIYSLERGNFYVETNEGYVKLLRKTATKTIGLTDDSSEETVLWFQDEFENIPTLYRGSKLVYRTNEYFNERFTFDKYLDLGYTFGLYNLDPLESGRYSFAVEGDTAQIVSISDANKFKELGKRRVIIDAIGDTPLRKDNVSAVGTVMGLEKDKEYTIDLYMGTEIQPFDGAETVPYTLKADVRALYRAQTNTSIDYEFLRSDIIAVTIPEYFQSGYYVINGFGLFRYVNGDSYDEHTDFNQINPMNMEEYLKQATLPENSINWSEPLKIVESGSWTLTIQYSNEINEELIPEGEDASSLGEFYVRVNINSNSYTLRDTDNDGTMDLAFNAPAGEYYMVFYNLYGRDITYSLDYVDAKYDHENQLTPSNEQETTIIEEETGGIEQDGASH